ncbi:16S rRNA (guanine(527)-N(7))-methyltransferase RsmG [Glycomyces sp. A-F 0318]|uniref:16S rRNA (guanine(527)-N(7))-methyltransferase RsmG n=1 Tax=Glycomyces amatae TaxID=2881355 RepID=UPI001E5837F8|nr:16S rRNA (guanine(527)-N(7))-methyltransferase RsmG [Glycomyces amatae]MCD0442081.1 16S rRNA (guanine(527)-N(7))-methyltransferase RsmG [Glycomyces amatae]
MIEEPESSDHTEANVSRETLASVFGDDDERIARAEAYVGLLSTIGIERGLIGPREVPRLWGRHVLGSAVIEELVPEKADVIDVGSGGGLPGIPLAIARPDLWVTLVEPMQRRVDFLTEVVDAIGVPNVEVLRARADEVDPRGRADVVVSRAVAPLAKLAGWCLPLARVGGAMMAVKGQGAALEVAESGGAVKRAGGGKPAIVLCGEDKLGPAFTVPATVVTIERLR